MTTSLRLALGILAALVPASTSAQEGEASARGLNSVTVFGGRQTRNDLSDAIVPVEGFNFIDTYFAGGVVAREVARRGGFAVELEVGTGAQWGTYLGEDNGTEHVWGAAYLRYDRFPWRGVVRTSVGASLGLNVITRDNALERSRNTDEAQSRLQHYFSPEIALALPSRPNVEVLYRVHHRSGVYGLFCTDCGSNIDTLGLRYRF